MKGQPGSTAAQEAMPPRLGRYRLVRPISTGGMARVFEGRRESLAGVSPRVAVKVILPGFATDATFQQLFVNEARIGSQLQHQNLVQIQDFDREGEHFYLVMEFVDGLTLRRAIGLYRKHGLLMPISVIAELGRQSAEGLHYAHKAIGEDGGPLHLVHRDVKPSNLMLNAHGVLKVLDFGVSKALFSRERTGTVKGTWGYMAPEQATGGEVGPLADVFGLAAVLFELAALQPLFPEKDPTRVKELLASDHAARRALELTGPGGDLVPMLVRALQRDPAARFPSAKAFGDALSSLMPDPVTAREQVLQFWQNLMEMNENRPPSTSGRSSSPRSAGSSNISASLLSQGSQPAREGLPVAVGGPPPAMPVEAPRRKVSTARLLPLLLVLLGTAILAYAAYTVLAPGPQPDGAEPPASLGAFLEDGASLPRFPAVEEQPEPPSAPRRAPSTPARGPAAGAEAPDRGEAPTEQVGAAESSGEATPPSAATTPEQPSTATEAAGAATGDAGAATGDAGAATGTTGLLTISSIPRAKVMVDGQYVRWTPMMDHELPAGTRMITLVTEDGRRTTFRVKVEQGSTVRRIWNFDKEAWVQGP